MINFLKNLILKIQILGGKKLVRQGSCKACGDCCKNLSLKHGKNVIKTLEEFETLQRKQPVYRMFKVMENIEKGLVFQCVHLDAETGKCTNYLKRPPLCRNYPDEIIFKLGGALSENCGFWFIPLKPFNTVLKEVMEKNK